MHMSAFACDEKMFKCVAVIRWNATEDQMLCPSHMPPTHPQKPARSHAPHSHPEAMRSNLNMQPQSTSVSAMCSPHIQEGPRAVKGQGQQSAVLRAADAHTQSDEAEEAQLGVADLTQEDHPDVLSQLGSQHSRDLAQKSACQQQCSSTGQQQQQDPFNSSSLSQHLSHPLHVQTHDAHGQATAHDVSDADQLQCRQDGVAGTSEGGHQQDESLDDLLEYLADAAAADQLHADACAASPQPSDGRMPHDNSRSNSNAAQQDQTAAALMYQRQKQKSQPNISTNNEPDAMLSIDLDSPGNTSNAENMARGTGRGANASIGTDTTGSSVATDAEATLRPIGAETWLKDDKEARMREAVRAVGLSKTARLASMQGAAAGLSGSAPYRVCCAMYPCRKCDCQASSTLGSD